MIFVLISAIVYLFITVYPKKYAHGFCFAVLCCGYTLTKFPISIRLTSLALWQSNDCPSASKATLMNMDKYFMWIHYERLHNHNKAKHNKTVCIFLGIYCRKIVFLCHVWDNLDHSICPWNGYFDLHIVKRGYICIYNNACKIYISLYKIWHSDVKYIDLKNTGHQCRLYAGEKLSWILAKINRGNVVRLLWWRAFTKMKASYFLLDAREMRIIPLSQRINNGLVND